MSSDAQVDAEAAPRRASTATVIGTMAAIALVSVVAVVVWARLGRAGDAGAEAVDQIPTVMAGEFPTGDVPPAVADAVDLPVVGVALLDDVPGDIRQECRDNFGEISWDGEPRQEYAFATPDGMSSSLIGKGTAPAGMFGPGEAEARQFRMRCTASYRDGHWMVDGGGIEPVRANGKGEFSTGGGFGCCDENGLATASGSVEVPQGAAWGLQERSGWYLAYPVKAGDNLNVTWKYRENQFGGGGPPQSRITFVDEEGGIVDEAFAGGHF